MCYFRECFEEKGNIITVGSGAKSTSSYSGTLFNQIATCGTFLCKVD